MTTRPGQYRNSAKSPASTTHYNQGVQALQRGDHRNALKHAFLSFEAAPQNHSHRLLLAHTMKNAAFHTFNPDLKTALLKLLNASKLDHQNLAKAWLSLLLRDPALQAFAALYHQQPYDTKQLQDSLKDPYLLAGLERFIVFDLRFERALKTIHTALQNQHLFCRHFEKALKIYNRHTEGLIFEDALASVALNENIPNVSSPQNNVHVTVRKQYEENPYPRWISCDVQSPPQRTASATHKHLIAGCGTGYGTCLTALRYPSAQITAIDLSLASLSYAKKKAKDLGIRNIEFYQADILDLENLNEDFDIIECSGVLHHMKDPLAGWRALLQKLKPDGKMHIGLYSELGRQDVVAARQIIADQGFTNTPEGIKSARDFLADLPDDHPAKGVLSRRDFYSLSGCRDLIFHTQEIRYTIDKIKESLEELGLRFSGFDLDNPQILQTYRAAYAADREMTNLESWAEFERTHPQTFRGMYQFWCRRK